MARQFGGKYSPDAAGRPESGDGSGPATLPPVPFRNRRASRVSLRARLMYLLPLPLLFAGLGAIGRGAPQETVAEIGGFALLTLSAWLLNDGLKAEDAYEARKVARPPAVPRKLFAALLTATAIAGVGMLSLGQGLFGSLTFGAVAFAAQIIAFGLDPMKKKGMEGVDEFTTERVARAVDKAEGLLRDTMSAAQRIGDRRLEGRVERLCGQAREMFRAVEEDPRDLTRARTFMSVYLLGLRDATVKFADIYSRSRDAQARTDFEALLGDLESSFTTQRTELLLEDRTDLDVEIEVLRERLKQDGLTTD